jgi:hypothetical membrane protein
VALRLSAVCGLLAPVAFTVGWVVGSFAQPARFDVVEDDISDLGAVTANHAWLYNRISANLAGLLVVLFALGLWRVLDSGRWARIGVAALTVSGLGQFLDGFFRLDCRAIDPRCTNPIASWHGTAHGIETVVTLVTLFVSMFALARAFEREAAWKDLSRPSRLAGVAALASLVLLLLVSTGIAVLVASTIYFLWIALVAYRLLAVARPAAPDGA